MPEGHKSSWSFDLEASSGLCTRPLTTMQTHLTHFQIDLLRTPNNHQMSTKVFQIDQKNKFPTNTDSILYIENFLEVSLWSKNGVLFVICWWPSLNSRSGHLKRSVSSSLCKLGQKPTGLPLCFPSKSSRTSLLCYKFLLQTQSPVLTCLISASQPTCRQPGIPTSWQASFCLFRQHSAKCVVNPQQT